MKFSILAIVAFAASVIASPLEQAANDLQRECREERGHECRDRDFHIKCEHLGEDRITCCRDRC
ncbi:hypothetical protein SBRCBS47491_001736 [Sporothrix bragantina]|uniref:Uncharacterized protein n=1 Tax=Sporothrix bragantina TaxID=671064 RepID=A0ABP0B1I7_9PEZI